VEAVNNKVQESFCKVMETLEDTLSAMEDNMSLRLSKIEHRLDSLEKVFTDPVMNFDALPPNDNLPTIDHEALASLSNDPMEQFEPLPSTPLVPTTPETLTLPSSSSQDDKEVGEDIICSLVTPSKLTGVQEVLEKEKERHRCALKLLPFFFTLEELSNSNTEGTHNKWWLDVTKFQVLKVLVFSRFPLESTTEKDKVWKSIKGKINSKCRLTKQISKHAGEREN